jgi:hypothetical protein
MEEYHQLFSKQSDYSIFCLWTQKDLGLNLRHLTVLAQQLLAIINSSKNNNRWYVLRA